MNHERIVLTDTASSLTLPEAKDKHIELIPFYIKWPDQQFTDFTISSDEIYRKTENHGIPSTSGPNIGDFIETYQKIYSSGTKEIFSIHLGLTSVTLSSAQAAANEMSEIHPDFKINIINSRALTVAQSYQALYAQELINQDTDSSTIIQQIDHLRDKTVLFGSTGPKVISYLEKSGRLHGLQLLLASKLHLIPIVSLGNEGTIDRVGMSRQEKKARTSVIELFRKEIDRRQSVPKDIGIVYTQDIDVGLELQYGIRDLLNLPNIRLTGPKEAGSVLATHVGPRTSVIVGCWG